MQIHSNPVVRPRPQRAPKTRVCVQPDRVWKETVKRKSRQSRSWGGREERSSNGERVTCAREASEINIAGRIHGQTCVRNTAVQSRCHYCAPRQSSCRGLARRLSESRECRLPCDT